MMTLLGFHAAGIGQSSSWEEKKRPVTMKEARKEKRPKCLWPESRKMILALMNGMITDETVSPVAGLPREMYAEIAQYVFPARSTELVAGPHPRGELWLERSRTQAVCKLGPSLVLTDDAVDIFGAETRQLTARFAFWGSPVFNVGIIDPSTVLDPSLHCNGGEMWFPSDDREIAGILNDGAGCETFERTAVDMTGKLVDVLLDVGKREILIAIGEETCHRVKIPERVVRNSKALSIGVTMWAGGRMRILKPWEGFPATNEEKSCK